MKQRTLKFWRWLYKFAEKRIRNAHRKSTYYDRKCPRCNTWVSVAGGCSISQSTNNLEIMECKKCNHKSTWVDGFFTIEK